jgi:hypothetical protein
MLPSSVMNQVRVWFLRVTAIAAIAIGGYLLYGASQDLSWTRTAIAEAGSAAYSPGYIQDKILAESREKERGGTAAEYTGFLLVAAGVIMESLASITKRLGAQPETRA